MKIGCLITQVTLPGNTFTVEGVDQARYDELAQCSLNSFKKFHPDVELHYVNDSNLPEYHEKYFKSFDLVDHIGIVRYMLAYDMMLQEKYDKIIVLGCDTITCARMDEFIDNNEDVLATLNYPCQESTDYWTTPYFEIAPGVYDHGNINADVVCFNNPEALKKVIDLSVEHFTYFGEQGALNELAWVDKSYSVKIVDFPYPTSPVVYNARSKGVFGTNMIVNGVLAKHGPPLDGTPSPLKRFYVKDNNLYTGDHKQIKCFHFVEGLGGRSDEEFNAIMNDFKYKWFNVDTIKFFKEQCGCSEFFN
jgi:regulator of RNase E activity RraB